MFKEIPVDIKVTITYSMTFTEWLKHLENEMNLMGFYIVKDSKMPE